MENIWLGRFPTRRVAGIPVVDHDRMADATRRLLDWVGLDIRPGRLAGDLSVSQVQMMELARALSFNAKVIILDEPTSSLSDQEVERLFGIIRRLRDEGAAIVYISHKMDEIRRISDEVSIMRDGEMIGTWPTADIYDRRDHHEDGRPRADRTGSRSGHIRRAARCSRCAP